MQVHRAFGEFIAYHECSRRQFMVVVKKTFGCANVFFYNHLYHLPVFRNLFLKGGISCDKRIRDENDWEEKGKFWKKRTHRVV